MGIWLVSAFNVRFHMTLLSVATYCHYTEMLGVEQVLLCEIQSWVFARGSYRVPG